MKLGLVLLCLGAVAGEWTCSRKDIARKAGNVCCNAAVGKMMKAKMKRGPSKKAAVSIRKELEKSEGGYWETIVAKSDFGFANYMVGAFHCKVEAKGRGGTSRTGMAWKVLGGGGGGKRSRPKPASQSESAEEPAPPPPAPAASPAASPEASSEASPEASSESSEEKPRSKRQTPNEKLAACCKEQNVLPACYNKQNNKANLCDFNEYTTNGLVNHYLTKSCPAEDMGKILLCASSFTGHNGCCADEGVKIPLCSVFCDAASGLRAPKPEEFQCSQKLNEIKSCFIRYMKYGPSYQKG